MDTTSSLKQVVMPSQSRSSSEVWAFIVRNNPEISTPGRVEQTFNGTINANFRAGFLGSWYTTCVCEQFGSIWRHYQVNEVYIYWVGRNSKTICDEVTRCICETVIENSRPPRCICETIIIYKDSRPQACITWLRVRAATCLKLWEGWHCWI